MIALLAALLAIVPVTNNSVSYSCDGSTSAFSINFPYIVNTDLVVTSTTSGGAVTTLTPTTDWTVTLTTLQSGTATLTVNVPATKCPSGSTLKIANNPLATQPYGFRAQTQYNTALHEQAYDREMMVIQNALNFAKTCPAHNWVSGWSGLLSPTCTQPTFSDMSGILPTANGGTGAGTGSAGFTAGTPTNGSIFNFAQSVTGNAIEIAGTSVITQTSGGGSSAVPIGFMGRSLIASGTWDHAVGLLGWEISTLAGNWRGAEGRVDANVANTQGIGISGLAFLNTANNAGTVLYAASGNCSATAGTGTGTCVGGGFSGMGGAAGSNFNASFGIGDILHGDANPVLFKGWASLASATTNVTFGYNDTLRTLHLDVTDQNISVMDIQLNDSAGAASFQVRALNFGTVFSINTFGTLVISGAGEAPHFIASGALNGEYERLPITTPGAPTAGADWWGTDGKWHFSSGSAFYSIAPLKAGKCTLGTNCSSITLPLVGMSCTCTDTTATNACRVNDTTASTTLTIVGTGTDVINYICLVQQ